MRDWTGETTGGHRTLWRLSTGCWVTICPPVTLYTIHHRLPATALTSPAPGRGGSPDIPGIALWETLIQCSFLGLKWAVLLNFWALMGLDMGSVCLVSHSAIPGRPRQLLQLPRVFHPQSGPVEAAQCDTISHTAGQCRTFLPILSPSLILAAAASSWVGDTVSNSCLVTKGFSFLLAWKGGGMGWGDTWAHGMHRITLPTPRPLPGFPDLQ